VYKYTIVIGDPCHDGHGQTELFVVETSHHHKDIAAAYKRAVEASSVSLDLETPAEFTVCCRYDDGVIPKEAAERLTAIGVEWGWADNGFEDDGSIWMVPQDMAHLLMQMTKTQLPTFWRSFVEWPREICAGGKIGYGCFT
jgi:hypothetical protein